MKKPPLFCLSIVLACLALTACESGDSKGPGNASAYQEPGNGNSGNLCSSLFVSRFNDIVVTKQSLVAGNVESIRAYRANLVSFKQDFANVICNAEVNHLPETIDVNERMGREIVAVDQLLTYLTEYCSETLVNELNSLMSQISRVQTASDASAVRSAAQSIRNRYQGKSCKVRAGGLEKQYDVNQEMDRIIEAVDSAMSAPQSSPSRYMDESLETGVESDSTQLELIEGIRS